MFLWHYERVKIDVSRASEIQRSRCSFFPLSTPFTAINVTSALPTPKLPRVRVWLERQKEQAARRKIALFSNDKYMSRGGELIKIKYEYR